MAEERHGLITAVEAEITALRRDLTAHMAREDDREERDAKTLALLEQMASEHGELMREWKQAQERKQRRQELWAKVQASVIGWAIVGLLAWLTGLGVAVFEHAVKASTHLINGGK